MIECPAPGFCLGGPYLADKSLKPRVTNLDGDGKQCCFIFADWIELLRAVLRQLKDRSNDLHQRYPPAARDIRHRIIDFLVIATDKAWVAHHRVLFGGRL